MRIQRCQSACCGAVLLGEGAFDLAFPVTVRHDGVVIRGSGSNKTTISFRYAFPESGVAFFGLQAGQTIGAATHVEFVGNLIHGPAAKRAGGAGKPMIERGNEVVSTDKIPPRPQPAVLSIFQWQREHLLK